MSQKHFFGLNYTLANEDSSFEHSLLKPGMNHICSIAGSGGRVIPLLMATPKRLTSCDVSQDQLYLTELRIESIRNLDHLEYLQFWSYPSFSCSAELRKTLFQKIAFPLLGPELQVLSLEAREYFIRFFEMTDWSTILYA